MTRFGTVRLRPGIESAAWQFFDLFGVPELQHEAAAFERESERIGHAAIIPEPRSNRDRWIAEPVRA
jgi:hypothetical protein